MSRRAGLPVALALLLPMPAAAEALSVRATASEPGRITLRVEAQPGAPLTVRDELTGAQRTLTPSARVTLLRRFASWSCAAGVRAFSVTQAGATARDDVRTPACAHRMQMVGPRIVRAPHRGAAHLFDSWHLGDLDVRFCVRPPGARVRCRSVDVRPGRPETTASFRAPRPGAYELTARTPYQLLRRTMVSRPPSGRLRVLATGDSMIQIIDSFLAQRLNGRRARVRSDARISTGISKPSLLDWRAHARRQARGLRPDATVMFIGANDGFAMGDAACCGAAWVAEYARRARRMMRSYARAGRGRVYWLLLPAPRGGGFRLTFPAVNAALRRAARGLGDDVRLIELDELFTPGGRYRDSIEIGGRRVRVRQRDGVHLNSAGAALAAKLVVRALRRDRMLLR